MRMALICFLLGGCSMIDGVSDGGGTVHGANRIDLGGESVFLSVRENLDRYTCGSQAMVCDSAGTKWECSCINVALGQR